MSGINVLSDNLKGGNKLGKTSTSKEKGVSDSPENAADVFGAMFSGFINLNDSKGQNSKVEQESEEKSGSNSLQGIQILNGQGSMLGYGNFALSNLFQPMLESDLPAGKEANSGNVVSQGTEGLAIANASVTTAQIVSVNNLELAMLNLVSLVSDEVSAPSGMTTSKPQGDNPGIPELDKYKQVIAKLLVELSGEVTDPSSKGNRLSIAGAGTTDLRQETAKIIQGWMTVTDEGVENYLFSSGQKGIERLIQGINELLKAEAGTVNSIDKESLDSAIKQSKGMGIGLSSTYTAGKATALFTYVLQKSESMLPGKGDSAQSTELSGVKDFPNLNSSLAIGAPSNQVGTNLADGKTVAVQVWEQISTVVREQVMDRRQALKELDIQLQPANLGKIQIGMRWENGQVHLVVQASEAATGQLLQNQLSDLRQYLINQGVNCGMFQMGQGGERQQNSHGDASPRSFNQNTNLPEGEEQSSVSNLLALEKDGINRINVMA